MITQPAEQNLFSLSSQSTSNETPITIKPLPPPSCETQSSAEHSFGWGDLPVLSGFSTFTSPPLKCDISEKAQEWTSTPPPPPSFSSKQSSSSYSRKHLLSDDYSSPSLAASVVSEDDDIACDDLDQYSEWLSSSLPLRSAPQHATERNSKEKNNERQVRFASVTVQEHEVVLGDHPWAGAYPLALGWQHLTREYTLEDYEQERLVDGRRLRSRGELPLRLSAWERQHRLSRMAGGCTSLTDLQARESKRQHEQENQTYPMCDDDEDEDDDASHSLCYQDKVRQLPADFYTTIVPRRSRRNSFSSVNFF